MSRLTYGLALVPVAAAVAWAVPGSAWVFVASALAIVPLAGLMGRATESLAVSAGPGVGGFLNATFGNAAELIIAIVAIRAGQLEVVKASISGSIIGNLLLVLGLSMIFGGARRSEQTFPAASASTHTTMLALAVVGLYVPALFVRSGSATPLAIEELSLSVAGVLMAVYLAGLAFTFVTHRAIFAPTSTGEVEGHEAVPAWRAGSELLAYTALVVWMSELLVGSIEGATHSLRMSPLFVGVVVVPLVGNAAEHASAVLMAMKDRMDVALDIAVGSSTQIALFVAPLLVFVSLALGRPMDYLFDTVELVAIAASVMIAALIAQDAKSNWLEGVQLVATYVILALAFWFVRA